MVDQVSFVDIFVDDAITDRVSEVLESGRYVKGSECESFEEQFASACGVKYAVGVSNGTAALLLAMKALDIGPGDEIFVPAHTYFATVSPVLELGADPVVVDIDPKRYTIDPESLRTAVERARNPIAIAVTHMHGQPAEMDQLIEIADEYDLRIIEDAAQAHLAEYEGRTVGSFSDVGCFSFYPTKNMTVGGDGGMITTDNQKIAELTRAYRNHGRNKSGKHAYLGLNYRLDEMKAVIGQEQLRHLPDWTVNRRNAASMYDEQLAGLDSIVLPSTYTDSNHVYHHYPIQVPSGERTKFREHLEKNNIGTGVHYEVAVHEHPAVSSRIGEVDAPIAEALCAKTVSLPMHPRLTDTEVEYVAQTVRRYFS